MAENSGPVKEFRAGNVRAAVWEREATKDGRTFKTFNVSVEKSYKKKDSDEWATTNSYNFQDLPKLALVAQKAFAFCALGNDE